MTPQGPRTYQWHLTADGTAIKAYPKALDHSNPQQETPNGLKYLRYATTRRLALTDLYAVEDALDASAARYERVARAVALTGVVGLAAMICGWIVLPAIGVDGDWTQALRVTSIPVLAAGVAGVMFTPPSMRRSINRIRTEGGLDVSEPRVLREDEALALLHAPGTVSGPAIESGTR
ncbi:hypothetical protein [Glycomyces algeriensis]|uniref:Uncharacterized protein n=1 Tax=Glycomyces algeriensis TaxID=256037 RepID=A0A9W6GAN1_9ACTN|nr:hypothetical protein [Glycomyces algeriensis]MDA1364669.1 hypothetical protein [Glycomyces algeriensis]MDR7350709.1 hypothetical protein [Glycomyces algeriensis]GLI43420.1 hypothetical protein GALLR39Z86_32700 [Glycomyces algeriensis]